MEDLLAQFAASLASYLQFTQISPDIENTRTAIKTQLENSLWRYVIEDLPFTQVVMNCKQSLGVADDGAVRVPPAFERNEKLYARDMNYLLAYLAWLELKSVRANPWLKDWHEQSAGVSIIPPVVEQQEHQLTIQRENNRVFAGAGNDRPEWLDSLRTNINQELEDRGRIPRDQARAAALTITLNSWQRLLEPEFNPNLPNDGIHAFVFNNCDCSYSAGRRLFGLTGEARLKPKVWQVLLKRLASERIGLSSPSGVFVFPTDDNPVHSEWKRLKDDELGALAVWTVDKYWPPGR